jgi:hypothetical protein
MEMRGRGYKQATPTGFKEVAGNKANATPGKIWVMTSYKRGAANGPFPYRIPTKTARNPVNGSSLSLVEWGAGTQAP